MSFTVTTGDLFAHDARALAHGVNCRGVAGAGVAAIMAKKYPDAIRRYKEIAQTSNGLLPGEAIITYDAPTSRPIIHCASQDDPGPNAMEGWLSLSLTEGLSLARQHGIISVAVPLIGGGIGGLDPQRAEEIIRKVSEDSPVDVTLVKQG